MKDFLKLCSRTSVGHDVGLILLSRTVTSCRFKGRPIRRPIREGIKAN